MKNIKLAIIIGLLFLSGLVSWQSYYKTYAQKDTVDIHSFPREIKGWTSEEMTLTEIEYEILETRNVIARKYTSPQGEEVQLLIVYSQNNRKVSHPPEVCYTGSGMTILNKKKVSIPPTQEYSKKLEFQRLLMEIKAYQQVAVYWFKVGSKLTPNYWEQQFLIAWNYLIGKPVSSAMVRISAYFPKPKDPAASDAAINKFAAVLTPELFKNLP